MSNTDIVVLVLLVAGVSNALFLFFWLVKIARRNRRRQNLESSE